MTLSLQGLVSTAAKEQGHKEIRIELVGNTDCRKARDLIMSRIGGNENITSVRWCVEELISRLFYFDIHLSKEGMMDIPRKLK
jgi:hypothetical protein